MLRSDEHEPDYRRPPLPRKPNFLGRQSAISSELHRLTPAFERSCESQTPSASASARSSFRRPEASWMTTNSHAAPQSTTMSLLTHAHFTQRSRSATSGTAKPDVPAPLRADGDDGRWHVIYHPQVAKLVTAESLGEPTFMPTLGELELALETNPKQFVKKSGNLANCRAANLTRHDGVVWRLVFTLVEKARTVRVLALAPHDDAYRDAARRAK